MSEHTHIEIPDDVEELPTTAKYVYKELVLLEGPATVSEIADRCSVPNRTVRRSCNQLYEQTDHVTRIAIDAKTHVYKIDR